jgi:hypothetical protein
VGTQRATSSIHREDSVPSFLGFQWGADEREKRLPYPQQKPCPRCRAQMRVEHLLPLPIAHMILVDYRCANCGFVETGIFEGPV